MLGAVHAVVFWITVSALTPFVLLVCLFNARRRGLHDILVGTIVINNEAEPPCRANPAAADALALGHLTLGRFEATFVPKWP